MLKSFYVILHRTCKDCNTFKIDRYKEVSNIIYYIWLKKSLSYHKTNEEDDDSGECRDNGNELPGGENQTCLIGIVVSVVVDE